MSNAHWVYNQTVKLFAAGAEPPFEDDGELMASWGAVWGIDNDVGKIRSILMHAPGPEMGIVDVNKRIEEIGNVERRPLLEGRHMIMILAPKAEKKSFAERSLERKAQAEAGGIHQ